MANDMIINLVSEQKEEGEEESEICTEVVKKMSQTEGLMLWRQLCGLLNSRTPHLLIFCC
jgi:hypothetical protein